MSTQFNDHALVDLDKLFLGDSMEIAQLKHEFETNGWCFVRLSRNQDRLNIQLTQIQTLLSTFFALRDEEKLPYISSNAFGYSRVNHKEGIKLLTDHQGLSNYHGNLSDELQLTLESLSVLLNDLTDRLKVMITMLPEFHQEVSRQQDILSPLNMLDVVHYYNRNPGPKNIPEVGYNTDEVNCVPHFDPGLFSLSILSTCDGLQLKDQNEDKWVDGPNNSQSDQRFIGVIWLGEAASTLTNNRFKAGIHRVVYPRTANQTRLTIWQEVCTKAQIEPLIRPNSIQQLRLPAGAQVTLTNQPNSVPFQVLPNGENQNDFMKRIESSRGLSMSKSAPSHFRFDKN